MWSLQLAFHSGPGLHTSLLQTDNSYLSRVGKISSVTDHPGGVTAASLQSFVPCILVLRLWAVTIKAVNFCSLLHPQRERQELVLGLGYRSSSTGCFIKPQFAYLSEGFWGLISFVSGLTSLMAKMLSAYAFSQSVWEQLAVLVTSVLTVSRTCSRARLPGFNHAS